MVAPRKYLDELRERGIRTVLDALTTRRRGRGRVSGSVSNSESTRDCRRHSSLEGRFRCHGSTTAPRWRRLPALPLPAREPAVVSRQNHHLYDLVRASNQGTRPARRRGPSRPLQVRPGVQQLIDTMRDVPVFVQNRRLDAVATNRLGAALFSEMFVMPQRPMNAARFTSSTPAHRPSTGTGRATPARSSLYCAPKPDGHPTTEPSPTSSVSSPPAATGFGPSGAPTTSGCTALGPRTCTTLWSGTST